MSSRANKTQPTDVSVEAFLEGVEPAARRDDAQVIREVMERLSGESARLWGPSIVGFGVRHYRYESGREGETPRVAFSPRKAALVFYGLPFTDGDDCLARLGRHTTGKGCLYVKRLDDIDLLVLEEMILRGLARPTMPEDPA
jgi:hypothetical protein